MQVKRLILVGTFEKCAFLILKSSSIVELVMDTNRIPNTARYYVAFLKYALFDFFHY
ncbi:hypothetical protein LEP1GSC021_4880 [Leptospira noguchii str. 1993005606]|nr:hypothetical protein LEP1GSC021_4880 [Leptospira noguchii str. 1993005606]